MEIFYSTRQHNPTTLQHFQKTGLKVTEFINDGVMGLTTAYNTFLNSGATEDIVIFAHDDIRLSGNWQNKILKAFEQSSYGIIGLAGSTTLSENCVWWENRQNLAGIVGHQQINKGKYHNYKSEYSASFGETVLSVCVIDGLFIAVHRKRIKSQFNEDIKGFHFYDISFCVDNFVRGVKIGVLTNIDIVHKSVGQLTPQWHENRKVMCELYEGNLPLSIPPTIENKNVVVKQHNTKVAIVIPTKDKISLLFNTIDSIIDKTVHDNYKIYVADTGSTDENKRLIQARYGNIVFIEYDYYNFAKINNDVVLNHLDKDTELLIFCNNDLQLINNAIDNVIDVYNKNKNVGTIGIKLLYENKTIQHGGILVGVNQNKQLILTHKGLNTFYGSGNKTEEVIGNTGAFLAIRKSVFDKILFNEQYIECFEDVELNLRCLLKGYVNFHVGSALSFHYESQTRKEDPKHLEKVNTDYNLLIAPFINKHFEKLKKHVKNI